MRPKFHYFGALKILIISTHFKIMNALPSVNLKFLLVGGECYTVFDSFSEEHLSAIQIVDHHVFKSGHQIFLPHQIKIYFLSSCNLNSYVSFVEGEEAPVV